LTKKSQENKNVGSLYENKMVHATAQSVLLSLSQTEATKST